MTAFDIGDLAWVPFPFVEAPTIRRRPALIISRPWQASGFRLYWGAMVTSLANAGWRDDVAIDDHVGVGLPAPSVVRPAKVASIVEETARPLGRLPGPLLDAVLDAVRLAMSLDVAPEQPY